MSQSTALVTPSNMLRSAHLSPQVGFGQPFPNSRLPIASERQAGRLHGGASTALGATIDYPRLLGDVPST